MTLFCFLPQPLRQFLEMATPGMFGVYGGAQASALETDLIALDKLPEAVLVAQNGLVAYANPRACRLFGVERQHRLRGLPLRQLLPDAPAGSDSGPGCRPDGPPFAAAWSCSAVPFRSAPAQLYIVRDAERERSLERRLQRREHQMRELSARVIEAQESERRQIARELHDEIGQCLSAIRVQFAQLQRRTESPEALSLIASATELTERTLGRVRSLSLLLHPPQLETLGLRAALRWHISEQQRLHDWRIVFNDADIGEDVPPDLAIGVYRIVQESLSNALRHGGARTAAVDLAVVGAELRVQIRDDGCGFDPQEVVSRDTHTLGILGMVERTRLLQGRLTVNSAPGKGTQVLAVFPYERAAA